MALIVICVGFSDDLLFFGLSKAPFGDYVFTFF